MLHRASYVEKEETFSSWCENPIDVAGRFVTQRSRPLCPYPQEPRFTGSVTLVGGVAVATNQADLADPTKYRCITDALPGRDLAQGHDRE